MTVSTEAKKVLNAPGNGVATSFTFAPLVIYASSELRVFTVVDSTGVETERTLGTGATSYAIVLNGSTYPDTGSITYPEDTVTPLPTGESLTVKRVILIEQQVDLRNKGPFFAKTVERAFDKATVRELQMQELIDRSPRVKITDALDKTFEMARTASRFLRWNAAADAIDAVVVATTTGSASDSAPPAISLSAGAAGSNAAYSRDDHTHLLPTTVPTLAGENVFTESMVWNKGSDVASGSALTLGAGNWFDITGTTAITSITSIGVGALIILHFDGAVLLTHNSTDLVLPGGFSITTVAGDEAMFYEYASGDWRLVAYNTQTPIAMIRGTDPGQKVTYHTDFLGDTIEAELLNGVGSGTGNAVALSAGAGGRVEIKTSSADAAISANGSSICLGALDWRADQGALTMEVRLQVDDITDVMFFVGFTDVLGSTVEAPIFLVAGDIDSDAANACGIGFDTDGTTDEWFHGGVKADADTVPAYSGDAPVNATYVTLRVEVGSTGTVRGFIDDSPIGAAVANAVTITTPLTPIVFVANRGGAVRNVLVDYLWVQANR